MVTPETMKRIEPQDGPQFLAAESEADILIYGGGAGGGKSWLEVNDPLRHIDNPGFRGGIFRRTYPQIKGQGGIWEEALQSYPLFGAIMREGSDLDATFPSGANIAFNHLQHEKTKYEYQGHQFAYLGFDELTHFTMTQFFYLLSRNRTTCGIKAYCRATCNPDAGSWVAEFIDWWIDPATGYPIPERSGVLRYFVREGDDLFHWADTKEELIEQFPDYELRDILSVSFIPALLDDNPALLAKDPGYRGKLRAQGKVERERLERGNWKIAEGAIIDADWFKRYSVADDMVQLSYFGQHLEIPTSQFRRFSTTDTAGTSKEKAAEAKGDPPSWSVTAIWDYYQHQDLRTSRDILILRYVWRARVNWEELKERVPEVIALWNVPVALIENAHFGQPLSFEMRGFHTELVGPRLPGMDDKGRGAKLERATASGMLTRLADIGIWVPDTDEPWVRRYLAEMTSWKGLPKETADQIDATAYACYHVKSLVNEWGGVIVQ